MQDYIYTCELQVVSKRIVLLCAGMLSGDFGGVFDKTKEFRDRIAELEEENGELLADARRHEDQLAVLKEELRAVDRAEKRAETSANAQVPFSNLSS